MLIGAKEPLAGGGPGCPERYFQSREGRFFCEEELMRERGGDG